MEAYELANLDLGAASAAYRFFLLHVLKPMAEAIAEMEGVYQNDTNAQLVRVTCRTRIPGAKRLLRRPSHVFTPCYLFCLLAVHAVAARTSHRRRCVWA